MLAIMIISSQIIALGVPNSMIKFFPELSGKTKIPQGLFWGFCLPPLLVSIVFTVVFLIFEHQFLSFYQKDTSLLGDYYLYILPLIFFVTLFSLLSNFLKVFYDTVFASFLQDVLLRLLVIGNLFLFSFKLISFNVFMMVFVGNYGLIFLILLVYAFSKKQLSFVPSIDVFTKEVTRRIAHYSLFSFFNGLNYIVIVNIDILMVGAFAGLGDTAIYSIAIYIGTVISVPKKSIGKISFPVIANSFDKNDMANVGDVYKKSSVNQYLIGLLIYIGIIANFHNLFAILPPEYATGAQVILIIGLANLFDMVTGVNGVIIVCSRFYRTDLYLSTLLVLLAVVFNYLFIPRFGIVGAASATALSIFIFNSIRVFYVWQKFKLQPFSIHILWITLSGIIIFGLSSLLPLIFNTYIDLLIRSVLISLLYITSVWIFKLSDEVNGTIKTLAMRFFPKNLS